jgi:hypothetical protein
MGALAAVPHDLTGLARGVLAFLKSYLIEWYIDFPALGIAAVIALVLLHRHRLFWAAVFLAMLALEVLNASQFDGAMLVPHRFVLLAFVSAVVVTVVLSEPVAWSRGRSVVALLVAAGVAYTTWTTVRFATAAQTTTYGWLTGSRRPAVPTSRWSPRGSIGGRSTISWREASSCRW